MFEGQKPDHKAEYLRWRTLKLEYGRSVRGWKAGPNIGVKCHYAQHSKPCRESMTGGVLKCPYCTAGMARGFTGYMPLIDEYGQKVVCVYGKDFEDAISRLVFAEGVKITKGKYKAAPVIVRADQWTTIPCPWLKNLRVEHDIRPWLLQLWDDEALTNYFGMVPEKIHVGVCDKPVTQTADEVKKVKTILASRNKHVEPLRNGKHHDCDPVSQ